MVEIENMKGNFFVQLVKDLWVIAHWVVTQCRKAWATEHPARCRQPQHEHHNRKPEPLNMVECCLAIKRQNFLRYQSFHFFTACSSQSCIPQTPYTCRASRLLMNIFLLYSSLTSYTTMEIWKGKLQFLYQLTKHLAFCCRCIRPEENVKSLSWNLNDPSATDKSNAAPNGVSRSVARYRGPTPEPPPPPPHEERAQIICSDEPLPPPPLRIEEEIEM